jgi:uroporphyrinogen decarboxylase
MAMMSSRQRVMAALNFEPTDRLPKDLGGMASTGISAFAYPKLVAGLGLPPRRPKVHDTYQMLALPDSDVLDALDCDVVTVYWGVTNAFEEPKKWEEYDFNGRLAALVRDRSEFQIIEDGTIVQPKLKIRMPISSYVFDAAHGGQSVSWDELPKADLRQVKKDLEESLLQEEQIKQIVAHCKQVRESTDRAVFFNGQIYSGISTMAQGGIGIFPVLCITEPNYVADFHGLITEYVLKTIDMLLPEICSYIDIIMLDADDWGTQNSLIASPDVFCNLFMPYLRSMNGRCHKIAPNVKTFLHSCGAIYNLIDLIIESGFDILNPVQWSAGGHSYMKWKDKCRDRIALWGGGVNSQTTLPLGSVQDIEKEVIEVISYLGQDGGYVFNNIHNFLAEIAPEKIIAMYRVARRY